ncbi:MAG: hypothetical protein ABIY70_25625 [Capsulimonas sp.]|uniref:MOSC domain-containing protein n=1 Tax=Capsulimonas sp. TaxID=2494211 RepID=UPI003263D7CD
MKNLTVTRVFVGADPLVSEEVNVLHVDTQGVIGDRHYGYSKTILPGDQYNIPGTTIWNGRQWSAISEEELKYLAKTLGIPEVRPEWLSVNIVFSGIGISNISKLSRIKFSRGAELLVYGECTPCIRPAQLIAKYLPNIDNSFAQRFVNAAIGNRGLVGWVKIGGIIYPNDTATIFDK